MTMRAMLALLPCAVVIAAVLGLGWSGLAAAAAALIGALVLVLAGIYAPPSVIMIGDATVDAAVLTGLVAATLVPGVAFIEVTRRLRAPEAVSHVVSLLHLPVPHVAVLVALGLGVLVESLTGMGVSLLLTVPLLVRLLRRSEAVALALVGMSLMPWGGLAIAGALGAALAHMDQPSFGLAIWRASGPIAALLPLLAIYLAGGRSRRDFGVGVIAGVVLWSATGAATWALGMALAGVAGGLALLAYLGLRAGHSAERAHALMAPALRPYGVLIAAVTIQTLAAPVLTRLGLGFNVSTGRVSVAVLTSPGLALFAASLLSMRDWGDADLLRSIARRSWRPVLSIGLFMLTARLLVSSGAIQALTAQIQGYGADGALAAVVALGAIGGFVTGSGVTGNALFLPSAVAVGEALGAKSIFAALCSAAAGHTAMASLPVAALLLTALPNRTAADDRLVLRWGLLLASGYLAVLMVTGWLSLRFAGPG